MNLSDAILLGSLLSEQGFGLTIDLQGRRCAFGAAGQALGLEEEDTAKTYPWLQPPMQCPVCGLTEPYGASVISVHLNDDHRWTRQRIAMFVAQKERELGILDTPSGWPLTDYGKIRSLMLSIKWREEPDKSFLSPDSAAVHVLQFEKGQWKLAEEMDYEYLVERAAGTTMEELIAALEDRELMPPNPADAVDILEVYKGATE